MQPRTLALVIVLLPLLAVNLSYLISAYQGVVPWCVPYIEGCTSISRAARTGDAIFLFRAAMMVEAVLLIAYWYLACCWLRHYGAASRALTVCWWLGTLGALFLILYVDFLGTTGVMYRLMRRYGVVFYFSFTVLAQMILLNQMFKLKRRCHDFPVGRGVLSFQLAVVALLLGLGLASLGLSYGGHATDERENVIEWLFSLLLVGFFTASVTMWRDLRLELVVGD